MKNLKSNLFLSNGNHGDGYEISVEEQNSLDKGRIKTNLETCLAESRHSLLSADFVEDDQLTI